MPQSLLEVEFHTKRVDVPVNPPKSNTRVFDGGTGSGVGATKDFLGGLYISPEKRPAKLRILVPYAVGAVGLGVIIGGWYLMAGR